ncbi:tetracycline resistance protein%2C class B [Salmonella enterica subsp. enterica serovar Typhi]|nr:tetracycline resistance protein%2C class B [Salmonella enterica subsp. enterica serovar Typhi]
MSIQTKSHQQGALQGLLVSLWDGWIWIIGLAFYCIIILLSMTFMLTPQAQGSKQETSA